MIEFRVFHNQSTLSITIDGTKYYNHHHFYFNQPLMFVNIMKNASTSMGEVIYDQIGKIDTKKGNFWFTIVRDPFERFLSTMKMLEGYNGMNGDEIIRCLEHYPEDASQDFLDHFMHFCPQRLVTRPYESEFDLKFYSIENLEPLRRDLHVMTSKEINILHLNQSTTSKSVGTCIERNLDFVNQFIEKDREWFRSLKIET